jgi:orotidine-5'-phosphate decarboxylase
MAVASQTPAERVIVPLDVPTAGAAYEVMARLPGVRFWKVGLELFVSGGPALLDQLNAEGKRIFLDLKFHDIPNTMAGACRAAATYGVDLLTVHSTAGSAALQAAQTAAQEGAAASGVRSPQVIAVTVLTSLTASVLQAEIQVPLDLADYAIHLARLSQASGLAGSVCSPHEAAVLRQACGPDWLLICPGVRPQGGRTEDQQRVMTPGQAIAAGADYLVIGRPITQAQDPMRAFQAICEEVASVSQPGRTE